MTIRALAVESIVVGRGVSCLGPVIPADLLDLPDEQLRVVDGVVVDAATLSTWYIDHAGQRHTVPGDGRTKLNCAWNDNISADGGVWRVETDKDRLDAAKALARKAIIARANAFTAPILSKYPEAERSGWDKREAEARAIIAAEDKATAIAATDIIKALSTAAGEDTAATVARAEAIVAKAKQFAAISAAVEVMRDQALTAIDAVEDAADMPALLASLDAQATALAQAHGLA